MSNSRLKTVKPDASTTELGNAFQISQIRFAKKYLCVLTGSGVRSAAAACPASHRKPRRLRPASDDKISTLAKKARLTEDDADRLYEAVVSHFSTTADVTRSALEQWQPTLTEDNIRFILRRRNVEAITVRLTPISFVTCCACSSLLLKVEQL